MSLKKDDGFSLLELAVTLGISAITTVMFLRYSLNTQNQDRNARFLAAINETMSTVNYALTKPETCTAFFQGLDVPTATGTNISLGTPSRTLLQTGTYQDFQISSIKLSTSVLATSGFDLVIQFTPRTTSTFNSYFSPSNSVITKRVAVVGVLSSAPVKVKTCGPIISDSNATATEVFCTSISALTTWDSSSKVCSFKNTSFSCPAGQVPDTITATGIKCIPILYNNKFDLTKLFDFGMSTCTTKKYTLYQNAFNKIAIGCPPTATDLARDQNLPP